MSDFPGHEKLSRGRPPGSRAGQEITFRGTLVGAVEVQQIRKLIARLDDRTQLEISLRVCRHFGWYRPNGDLAELAFLGVLRRLRDRGLLRLPAPRNGARRQAPSIPACPSELRWPDQGLSSASAPGKLVVRPIHAGERAAWRQHIAQYHYLGHRPLVGESLCYAAFLQDKVVALIGWSSAALRNTPRDAYVGWNWDTKCRRLSLVVNNMRFLVLPGARGPNLASRILAANLRRLSQDWQALKSFEMCRNTTIW